MVRLTEVNKDDPQGHQGYLGVLEDGNIRENVVAFEVIEGKKIIHTDHTNFLVYKGLFIFQNSEYQVFEGYKYLLHDLLIKEKKGFCLWGNGGHPSKLLVDLISDILRGFSYFANKKFHHNNIATKTIVVVEYLDGWNSTVRAKYIGVSKREGNQTELFKDAEDLCTLMQYIFRKEYTLVKINGLSPESVKIKEVENFFTLWTTGYFDDLFKLGTVDAAKLLLHPLFFDDVMVMKFLSKIIDFIDSNRGHIRPAVTTKNWSLRGEIYKQLKAVKWNAPPYKDAPDNLRITIDNVNYFLGWSYGFDEKIARVAEQVRVHSGIGSSYSFYLSSYQLLKFFRNFNTHFIGNATSANVNLENHMGSESLVVSLIRKTHVNLIMDAYQLYENVRLSCHRKNHTLTYHRLMKEFYFKD